MVSSILQKKTRFEPKSQKVLCITLNVHKIERNYCMYYVNQKITDNKLVILLKDARGNENCFRFYQPLTNTKAWIGWKIADI